jgi:hypothetical protein
MASPAAQSSLTIANTTLIACRDATIASASLEGGTLPLFRSCSDALTSVNIGWISDTTWAGSGQVAIAFAVRRNEAAEFVKMISARAVA